MRAQWQVRDVDVAIVGWVVSTFGWRSGWEMEGARANARRPVPRTRWKTAEDPITGETLGKVGGLVTTRWQVGGGEVE